MPNPVPKVRGVKLTKKMLRMKPHSHFRESKRNNYHTKHPFIPNPEPLNRVKELKNYRNYRRALKQSNGSISNSRRALKQSITPRPRYIKQSRASQAMVLPSPIVDVNNSKSSHPLLNNMEIKPISEKSSEFNPIFYKAQNGRPGVKLG